MGKGGGDDNPGGAHQWANDNSVIGTLEGTRLLSEWTPAALRHLPDGPMASSPNN